MKYYSQARKALIAYLGITTETDSEEELMTHLMTDLLLLAVKRGHDADEILASVNYNYKYESKKC